MSTLSRALAAILICVVLPSCSSITTVNPVGISRGMQQDARLAGVWKIVEAKGKPVPHTANEKAYLIFIPETTGEYSAVFSNWGIGDPKPSTLILDLIVGRIADQTLFNARLLGEISKPGQLQATMSRSDELKAAGEVGANGFWLFKYRIAGDGRIRIYAMSDEGFKIIQRAIEGHQLEGTVKKTMVMKNDHGPSSEEVQVRITATPAALDIYFANKLTSIFTAPMYTFEKID
jgi:hypothetical protein